MLPLSKETNVEVKGATFLYALAALLITLAGFSALLLSIRQMAGARLSLLDRFVVRTILIHPFILTGGAAATADLGIVECFGNVALARRRAVFCDPDAGPPINLFAPTQKSCRDRSTPSRFRGLYSCGECRNRSDADLHHRRFRVPGSRLYHRLDHQFFYYRVWLCDRS